MSKTESENTNDNAAGTWQTGEPTNDGRYLVEYEQHRQKNVFVMDYSWFDGGWRTHGTETKVLRWAKINSDYA